MTRKIKIGRLVCDYVGADGANICYILSPLRLDVAKLSEYSKLYGVSIVSVTGMDWDNDMTPWPAKGVNPRDDDFKGDADEFLRTLRNEIIPQIESELQPSSLVTRLLIGISLSGLFAVWAWMQDDTFKNIASISGSFWYDGFSRWLSILSIPEKNGCAYFSLGDKEGGAKGNPRFSSIATDTAEIIKTLQTNGIRTMFELTAGTHYAPIYPRLKKAMTGLKNMESFMKI